MPYMARIIKGDNMGGVSKKASWKKCHVDVT